MISAYHKYIITFKSNKTIPVMCVLSFHGWIFEVHQMSVIIIYGTFRYLSVGNIYLISWSHETGYIHSVICTCFTCVDLTRACHVWSAPASYYYPGPRIIYLLYIAALRMFILRFLSSGVIASTHARLSSRNTRDDVITSQSLPVFLHSGRLLACQTTVPPSSARWRYCGSTRIISHIAPSRDVTDGG